MIDVKNFYETPFIASDARIPRPLPPKKSQNRQVGKLSHKKYSVIFEEYF